MSELASESSIQRGREPARRRWRGPVVLAAVALVAAGAGAGVRAVAEPARAAGPAGLPPATTTVTRTTLTETADVAGTLGFGETSPVIGRLPGTLTAVPAEGGVVERGHELYRVDDTPVLLLFGARPAYRDLRTGIEGADVRQLEENLRALGHTGFTVDDTFTSATAAAVSRWQRDLGLPRTGRVELGRVVFAATPLRVAATPVAVGEPVGAGQAVLQSTGTARLVSVALDVGDRALVRDGAEVAVGLPGGAQVSGTVTAIGSVASEPGKSGEPSSVAVEIAVADAALDEAGAAFDRAPATVTLVVAERVGVLAVPVAALLARPGGGYGVEVVENGGSRIVPVTTGVFAGGSVEVTGAGVEEGTVVGVPAR